MLFNGPDNPQKLPFPLGGPGSPVIYSSLGPRESALQSASRSVQRFCIIHERDQQTDKHTDDATLYIAIAVMRPKTSGSVHSGKRNACLASIGLSVSSFSNLNKARGPYST